MQWQRKSGAAGALRGHAGLFDSLCFVLIPLMLGFAVILFDLKFGIARLAEILFS